MARPKKDIDPDLVFELAKIHCSFTEMAAVLHCSVDTLNRRFADIIAKGREEGKIKLRRLQWQSAEKGNVVMQLWLGKQYLGQTEKIQQQVESHSTVEVSAQVKEHLADLNQIVEISKNEAEQIDKAFTRELLEPRKEGPTHE